MLRSLASMTNPRETYPPGVSCFIDTERTDVDAAMAFYGGLFGWTYEERHAAGRAALRAGPARRARRGRDRRGVQRRAGGVEHLHQRRERGRDRARRSRPRAGRSLLAPFDFGTAGRMAVFADPEGAAFRVWQAGEAGGARARQRARARGTGATSRRATSTPRRRSTRRSSAGSTRTSTSAPGAATMIRVPGYGEHLEALNPGTLARHKEDGAPEGFSDAIGWMQRPSNPDGPARWAVTFTVADADETAARTAELGGTVLAEPFDVPYSRMTVIRDPEGATLHARPVQAARLRAESARGARGGRVAATRRGAARPASGQRVTSARAVRGVADARAWAVWRRRLGRARTAARRAASAMRSRVAGRLRADGGAAARIPADRCAGAAPRRRANPLVRGAWDGRVHACPRLPQAHARPADRRGHLVRAHADAGGAVAAVLRREFDTSPAWATWLVTSFLVSSRC